MKNLLTLLLVLMVLVLSPSCKKTTSDSSTTLGGDPSPMGAVGTTVSSSSVPVSGVGNINCSVVTLSDGVSSYSGTAIITSATVKNILANFPEITIKGDSVIATGFKFKQTTEGIESFISIGPGIIANYNSSAGDTYPVGSTGRTRTVTSKSSTDDYYYGLYLIKVMKIEEPTPGLKSMGVDKITYWANHKFGLVGVQYNFSDGSSINLPVYCSASNGK